MIPGARPAPRDLVGAPLLRHSTWRELVGRKKGFSESLDAGCPLVDSIGP
jgi:hypothetical protein